ncbi:hypothetical protein [Pseudomonas sp. S9]|uniref:hypothetical protein n=1 Tax=Pseudomonas sp. S9 TaxID=686578 RepID=UPI0011105082|nr:hypothetical protein [Pseudomonas sp. S9]
MFKELRVYKTPRDPFMSSYFAVGPDGVYTPTREFQASEVDGPLFVVGLDDAPPAKYKGISVEVVEDGTIVFDISTEVSSGVPTVPATFDARVWVDNAPSDREVIAIEKTSSGEWRVCGFGKTLEGQLDVDLKVASSAGYAVALDDFGTSFVAGASVSVGDRVRPTLYVGWLYEVTEAGNLPSTEPEWWIAEEPNAARLIGSARVVAVRYYRPLAHGPFPFELT